MDGAILIKAHFYFVESDEKKDLAVFWKRPVSSRSSQVLIFELDRSLYFLCPFPPWAGAEAGIEAEAPPNMEKINDPILTRP